MERRRQIVALNCGNTIEILISFFSLRSFLFICIIYICYRYSNDTRFLFAIRRSRIFLAFLWQKRTELYSTIVWVCVCVLVADDKQRKTTAHLLPSLHFYLDNLRNSSIPIFIAFFILYFSLWFSVCIVSSYLQNVHIFTPIFTSLQTMNESWCALLHDFCVYRNSIPMEICLCWALSLVMQIESERTNTHTHGEWEEESAKQRACERMFAKWWLMIFNFIFSFINWLLRRK